MTKRAKTTFKAIAMLCVRTAIQPMSGVITAPPIIAVTMNEAPSVVAPYNAMNRQSRCFQVTRWNAARQSSSVTA